MATRSAIELIRINFDQGVASLEECGLKAKQISGDEDVQQDQSSELLLDIAHKQLNVFPYHAIEQRWFNLYADMSVVKAAGLFVSCEKSSDPGGKSETSEKLLCEAIAALDNALIVAGGGDTERRSCIQGILSVLEENSEPEAQVSDEDAPPAKRRRVEVSTTESERPPRLLPANSASLPLLKSPVRTLDKPALTTFEIWTNTLRQPFVLDNTLTHWPALTKWKDVNYWLAKTLGGRRIVPIEIGQSYHDDNWRQELLPFKDFLDKYILKADDEHREVGYLAQHDIFSQIEGLRKDIAIPDYCYCDVPDDDKKKMLTVSQSKLIENLDPALADEPVNDSPTVHHNLWFGGRTVSPLHHDPYHNILCQVHGTKYIRLYSPEYSKNLYPRSKTEPAPHTKMKGSVASDLESSSRQEASIAHSTTPAHNGCTYKDITTETDISSTHPQQDAATIDMSNNSSVNIYAMELSPHEDWDEVWPRISEVPYFECLLKEGQALYIPKGWWHYIRGLTSSGISVSFWW